MPTLFNAENALSDVANVMDKVRNNLRRLRTFTAVMVNTYVFIMCCANKSNFLLNSKDCSFCDCDQRNVIYVAEGFSNLKTSRRF